MLLISPNSVGRGLGFLHPQSSSDMGDRRMDHFMNSGLFNLFTNQTCGEFVVHF